jgi:hypothetical protein
MDDSCMGIELTCDDWFAHAVDGRHCLNQRSVGESEREFMVDIDLWKLRSPSLT